MIQADLNVILPEIVIAIYAMLALLGAVYTGKDKMAGMLIWLTAALFIAMAFWIGTTGGGTQSAFSGLFIDDGFSRFAKVMILVAAAAILLMSQDYMARQGSLRFEYPILIALSAVGMMTMVSAGDLMTLYMGLELQSLSLYILASMGRDTGKSTEAGLKYFVLGALASGILLYGASLTYGYAGTTSFSGIIASAEGQAPVGLLLGMVLVMIGLAFKVSAVPFHMWTPDVYEGAPTPVTAYFATAPKVAAMALLARTLFDAYGGVAGDWSQVLAVMSLLSMFLGSIAAIGQRDIKRMMAYSTIGHMGFALMGLAGGGSFGVQAMLVYMAIYVAMDVGAFTFILTMQRDGRPVTEIASLNHFAKAHPSRALAMLVLMFSLGGVPPFLGFFAKIYVLRAAYEGGLVWLAVAGVVASVIGAYYYLRIVYYMYFGEEREALDPPASPVLWGILVVSAAIIGLAWLPGVNMFGIEGAAQAAAATLVN